jgi:hypothetical protein
LNLPTDKNIISKAQCPVFDGIQDSRLRSLIAVGLGCDVNQEAAVTPARMLDFLKSEECLNAAPPDAYFAILKFFVGTWEKKKKAAIKKNIWFSQKYIEKKQYTEMLEVYVDAFLYKPVNILDIENNTIIPYELTYIHHPPNKPLHHYLHEFCNDKLSTSVVDCSECCTIPDCIGAGAGCHKFMSADGQSKCSKCMSTLCMQCIFLKKSMKKKYTSVTIATYRKCPSLRIKSKVT